MSPESGFDTSRHRHSLGMTLTEMMVSVAIGSVILLASSTFLLHGIRSTAAVVNYVNLDNYSRSALSTMLREIRGADTVTSFSSTQMSFQSSDPDNPSIITNSTYTYDPTKKTVTRSAGGKSKVVLMGCQIWQAAFYQRNTVSGTYDQFPVDDSSRPDLCKVIQLTWSCSRRVSGRPDNTEGVQSAKVVLRKP